MARRKIPEVRYRASRICRVLGNPTAYEILHVLSHGEKMPGELAHIMGLSLPVISQVLRTLRQLDLIRYEVRQRERVYWIKEDTVLKATQLLEELVKKIKTKEY